MKVTVKLSKAEKKKLARLKRDVRSRQAKMDRAYAAMERAWKRGKAPKKIASAMDVTTKRAVQSWRSMVQYYGKLRRKFPKK